MNDNSLKPMHPYLDKQNQIKAQQYEKEKRLFGFIGSTVSLIFLIIFYYSGASTFFAFISLPNWLVLIVYLSAFTILSAIVSLPVNFFQSYVHEHKWEFSNQSVKSWSLDQLKGLLVSIIISTIMIGLLLFIMSTWSNYWWLIAGLAMALVSIVLVTLFPVVILPLFNKYETIKDEVLTAKLNKLLLKAGLKASGFFKQDLSRQTKKENGFLAGLGKTRRVVLADNLLENMNQDEIQSVIAHEVGHYQHRHLWKNIFSGTGQQLIIFYLLNIFIGLFSANFLTSFNSNLSLLPVLLITMNLLSGVLFGPLNLMLSRYFELQADESSLRLYPNKEAFLQAMAGLANRNLSNAYPSKWIKWLYYSHPPIGERLAFAEKYLD